MTRTMKAYGRGRRAALTCSLAALAALPATLGAAASGPSLGQRIDMKVLLLSATGTDSFGSWKAVLDKEGIPYDAKVVDQIGPITDADLADYGANRAYYQGIILTDGDLLHDGGAAGWVTALDPTERAALDKLQATFGVRQISDNTVPSPTHGLNWASSVGTRDGTVLQVNAAGKAVFPELKGPVPIPDNDPAVGETWGYDATPLATPNAGETFTSLVDGPGGSSYVGVHGFADGREEMVVTVNSNLYQIHNQLLRRGMLNWVTRGVHLGGSRNYYSMHIDDIFLPDDKWDPDANATPGEEVPCGDPGQIACATVRMTPRDVNATINFQNSRNFVFDFAYNGFGYREPGSTYEASDPLGDDATYGLLKPEIIAKFRWINHTWSHPNLDLVPLTELVSEINQNITFASQHALPIDRTELVTGEHSGLGSYFGVRPNTNPINPNMATALTQTGIRWIGDDNSVKPDQRLIGSALSVPRYPSNVYYNVASRSDQLDEYNYIYLPPSAGGKCENTAVTTCRTSPATWDQYVGLESSIMMSHVLGNDPRPHYAHQSNLIVDNGGNGILFGADGNGVMDEVFTTYDSYYDRASAPLINPGMTEAGQLIGRQAAWQGAKNDSAKASAYLLNGKVYVTTAGATQVPITGTSVGEKYAGVTTGWATVNGSAVFDTPNAVSVSVPTITGTARVGQTLTVTPGGWPAGATPTREWQKCDAAGANCAAIGGATDLTYVPVSGDRGARIKVVESVGAERVESALTAAVVDPKMLTAPVITGTPRVGTTLRVTAGVWQDVTAVTRQWQRCSAAGTCSAITGATGTSYVLTTADRGATIKVVETAAAQGVSGASVATGVVIDPRLITSPAITGTPAVGSTLTTRPGVWQDVVTVTRQWQRCDSFGCRNITGATGLTYRLTTADTFYRIRVVETARALYNLTGTGASARTSTVFPAWWFGL